MRDLFQVVFELKKKEIELAKQHIEQKSRFGATSSSLFTESALSSSKVGKSTSKTLLSKLPNSRLIFVLFVYLPFILHIVCHPHLFCLRLNYLLSPIYFMSRLDILTLATFKNLQAVELSKTR